MIKRIIFALAFLCPSLVHAQATNYCNNQSYNTFEGGTIGAQPTSGTLNASQHGFNTGTWTQNGGTVMTYSSMDMPALVAPGRLCADLTTYTNSAGLTGIVFTGDGLHDFNTIQYNLAATVPTDVWATIEYNEDYGDGDPSKIDAFIIHGANDFVLFNAYGTSNPGGHRYINIECTVAGCGTQPNVNWEPSTQCPCKIILHYQAQGTHSLTVLDKNGALIASFTGPAAATRDVANRVAFGDVQNNNNVTSGKHSFFDNLQVSLDNTIPGQFCKGASPTWTSSPDSASAQSCFTSAASTDIVNALPGTATWNAVQVNDINGANWVGATTCTGTGTPSASCVDGTIINLSNEASWYLAVVPASNCSTVATLSGLTFNWLSGGGSTTNGVLFFTNNHCAWPLSGPQMRLTNSHIVTSAPGGGSVFGAIEGMFGLIDHNLYVRNSGNTGMFGADGDRVNRGYPPWLQAVAPGTTQALYIETNTFIDNAGTNTEGPIDCYSGARYVFRFNYVQGTHNGGCHGTDTDTTRSVMWEESYGNTYLNNNTPSINYTSSSPVRGGSAVIFGETYQVSGTGASWAGVELQCDRCAASTCTSPVNGACPNWGLAVPQLYLESATPSAIGAVTSTTSVSAAQFCFPKGLDNLIPTGNNAGCAALNAGDSAAAFLDGANSTTSAYPVRDQVGRVHTATQGQALAPVYIWSLTPAAAGEAFVFPATTNIQECRDYYQQFSGTFTGACSAGNGVGVGLLSARPATCTTGVGYFATDQGNWNSSGNGFGQGQLYQCSAPNTWTLYYVPLAYPHPLVSSSVSVAPSTESFGSVVVGASSATQTATLTNGTASSITISSVTTTGNTSDFPNTVQGCSGTIAGNGGTCSVTTKFSPTSTGARSATLTIATSVGSFPVSLSGTGTSAVNPGVSISPAFIAFGNQSVGAPTPGTVVTITSTTSANLVMGTPPATITGTNAGDFSLQAVGGQCSNGQSIPQSSTCIENVVFLPTATGARSAQLNIFDNVAGNPQVVTLSGTGVGTIAINPATLNYGLIAQGQTSASQLLTITNNTGVTLTLTGTSFSNLDFASTSNTCNSGSLTNGSSCTATITFRPSATTGTNETGFFNVGYTGVGGSPVQTPLSGTVLPPIGTPATNIFAWNQAGCGTATITTFCFTATGSIYVAVCNPNCKAFKPMTMNVTGVAQ